MKASKYSRFVSWTVCALALFFLGCGNDLASDGGEVAEPNSNASATTEDSDDDSEEDIGKRGPPLLDLVSLHWCPPRATTTINIVGNLDATEVSPTIPFDANDPSGTSNFSTTITVYDFAGVAHSLDTYYVKAGPNVWEFHALATSSELAAGGSGNTEVARGTLLFNDDGSLQTQSWKAVFVNFKDAEPEQLIFLELGPGTEAGGSGLDGLTQFESQEAISFQEQDGYTSGEFYWISLVSETIVEVHYTNGEAKVFTQPDAAEFIAELNRERAGGGTM